MEGRGTAAAAAAEEEEEEEEGEQSRKEESQGDIQEILEKSYSRYPRVYVALTVTKKLHDALLKLVSLA